LFDEQIHRTRDAVWSGSALNDQKFFGSFFQKRTASFLLLGLAPYLHPGEPGWAPQPAPDELIGAWWAGLGMTVPSLVTPCAVHSQKPPTGMVVAQVSFSAWQMLVAEAVPAASVAARMSVPRRIE
jgi:hypothetical protein